MKKLFFFAAFLCAASLTTVNAQCTGAKKTASTKTSCTSAAKTASSACCAKTTAAMAKAVSADSSIEKKVCSVSGKETFYRNSTCQTSGTVTSTEVVFDAKQNTFVNVSPTRGAQPAAEATATTAKKANCAASCAKGKKSCGAKSTKQASTAAEGTATFTKGEEMN